MEAEIINQRAYAGLLLVLALLAASCSGTNATSPGGPEPAQEEHGAIADPDPAPEPGAAEAPEEPDRPERADLAVHAEQVEVTLPFVLVRVPDLGFSTYVFEEYRVEFFDDPAPGIRASDPHPGRSTFIEVTALPAGTGQEEARAALSAAADAPGGWVQPGVPVRPWAVDTVTADHGHVADVYFLVEHGGRYLLMRQHFAWVDAEALGPVLEGFLNEWLWDDGGYLVPR